MELLTVLAALVSYLCFSLLAARHWYGKWRIEEAEKRAGVRPYKPNEVDWSDGRIAGLAAFTGLFWWGSLPFYGVRALIMHNPPQAPHEVAAEKDRLKEELAAEKAAFKNELAELERENEELRRGQEGT